jgi:hypothetical protein
MSGIMETIGQVTVSQSSIDILTLGQLPLSQYSLDSDNSSAKANNMSWKTKSPVLHHDPSFSGELDPYTVIILSQL